MADLVEIILALRNVRQFVGEAGQAEKAIGGIGYASEKTGKQASISWKGVAKWAGGAAVIYGAQRFIRGAVSATEDLAKSTLALQRSTNLDTQTASEWAALTKERGISTRQFQVGLKTLSVQMEKSRTGTADQAATIARLRHQIDLVAAAGGKKAPAELAKLSTAIARSQTAGEKSRKTLAALGITQSELAKGDTATVLYQVADAMQHMQRGSERVALATKLFGRSGQMLLPILMQGREGVQKLLDEQRQAGNYISGKGINDTKKLIEQQRALDRSYQGLRVQLGQALLPIMLSVGKILVALARYTRPLTSRAWALKLALAALVVTLIALKIATIAQAVAAGENTMATAAWAAAQWLLNVAFYGFPLVWLIAGIIALGVVFVVAYKKVGWFHTAIDALWHGIVAGAQLVFEWFKAYWPYLLGILGGPFALAAVLIIKHFGTIKRFVLSVVDAIRAAFENLVSYVKALPGKILGYAKKIPGYGAASKALGFVSGAFAAGGVAANAGAYLVGERGPEVVALPRGAAVSPLPAAQLDAGTSGRQPFEITVPVVVDGREIARAVARVTADKLARK